MTFARNNFEYADPYTASPTAYAKMFFKDGHVEYWLQDERYQNTGQIENRISEHTQKCDFGIGEFSPSYWDSWSFQEIKEAWEDSGDIEKVEIWNLVEERVYSSTRFTHSLRDVLF